MRYKGILFDLDGTLLDTNELVLACFQHTIRRHYNRDADLDLAKAYFGKPLRDALVQMGPDPAEDMIATYRAYNVEHHDRLAKIFAGVAQTVQLLFRAGVKLAVVTSKMRPMALRGLRLFDLDKYFAAVIGHEDCCRHKPEPEPVLKALSQLGLPPEDCLMVGDSPFDLQSGRRAGLTVAAVRWTAVPWQSLAEEQPDYILETMEDLLAVVGIEGNQT